VGCLCAGAGVLSKIDDTEESSLDDGLTWLARLGTAFIIGGGLLSVVFLALAEFSQLKPLYVGLAMAIAIGAGIWPLKAFLSKRAAREKRRYVTGASANERPILVLTLMVIFFSLFYATARLSYDSVALYFSDAKIAALTHSVRYFVDDSFVVSLFHTSIQYAALIELFGDQAARMYSWASGIIVMLFSLALAKQLGLPNRGRVVLLAMIASSTAILDLMGDGKIDLASSAPAMAAIYWMVVTSERRQVKLYVLTGFLAGMAMAARPYNIFLAGALIGIFEIQRAFLGRTAGRTLGFGELLRALLWIGVGALPWLTYHLASNWIILGDPIAFIRNYEKLSTGTWQWSFSPNEIWLFRLIYPITVTFLNTPQSLGSISPLFVGLIPLGLLKSVRDGAKVTGPLAPLITATALTLLAWILLTFMVFEIRYVMFLWIILFMPVAALIAGALENVDALLRSFVRLSVITLLGFLAIRAIYISVDAYSPLDTQGNAHCYDLAACELLTPINRTAQAGERVLTLNAFRYYLRTELFACSTTESEYSRLEELSRTDNIAFWTEVYRDGYKYVAYESNYSRRHLYLGLIPNPYNTPAWLKLEPIFGKPGDTEVTYRIQAPNPPIRIEKQCNQTSGTWEVQSADGAQN
jgi:hypothetical protein